MRFVAREKLSTCVHCGLCLASCPTYVELGTEADSPRGRIHLMRALEDGTLAPTAEVVRHLDLCLGCRACETACPSGVEYGTLIEAARPFVEMHRPRRAQWMRRGLAAMLASRVLGPVAVAPLRVLGGRRWARALAGRAPLARHWLAFAAAGPDRPAGPALPDVVEPVGARRGTAVLLSGCAPAALFSSTQRAAAALLAQAGVRVIVPRGPGCCGALALHLGGGDRARALARETAARLGAVDADWVVTTAAGCGALLRQYDHLLPGNLDAAKVTVRARDALELLADLELPAPSGRLDATLTIHDPCHLAHAQGVRAPVRRLLASIPGVRLVELEESDMCCGSAGTYNLTERAMARRLLARKIARIAATGAETVAVANPGCLLQIRAGLIVEGLAVRADHPLDLLAEAHGLQSSTSGRLPTRRRPRASASAPA